MSLIDDIAEQGITPAQTPSPAPQPYTPNIEEPDTGLGESLMGLASKAYEYGLHPLLTVLDTPGRFVRTALHTGDFGKAAGSVFNPEQGSSSEDLLRDVGYESTEAGENRSWGTAIQDFLINAGVGMITDPLTYLGVGALTRAGEATMSLGRQAARFAALGDAANGIKAGVEGAADLARWFNNTAKVAEETHGLSLPRIPLLPEGADAAAKAAHFEQVQDFLGNFGMGKSFRERLAMGQQSILGFGNPFGHTMGTLVGGGEAPAGEAAFQAITGRGLPDYSAMGPFAEGAGVPLLNRTLDSAEKTSAQRMVNFLGDTADVVSYAAGKTALGRKAMEFAGKLRDFVFNPVDKDALDEIRRVAPTLKAPEVQELHGQLMQFSKTLDDLGLDLEGRKLVTRLSQIHNVADQAGEAAALREQLLKTLGGDTSKMARLNDAMLNLRRMDETIQTTFELPKMGEWQGELLGDAKRVLGEAKAAEQDALVKEQAFNAAKVKRDALEADLAKNAPLKNAEALAEHQAQAAMADRANAGTQARKDFIARVRGMGLEAEQAGHIQTGAERMAAAYGEANGVSHNHWFQQRAPYLSDEDLQALARPFQTSDAAQVPIVPGVAPKDAAKFYAKGWTKEQVLALDPKEVESMLTKGIEDLRAPRSKIGNITVEKLKDQPTDLLRSFESTLSQTDREAWSKMVAGGEAGQSENILRQLHEAPELRKFGATLSEDEQSTLTNLIAGKLDATRYDGEEIPFGRIFRNLKSDERAVLDKYEAFLGKSERAGVEVNQGLLDQYKDYVNDRFSRGGTSGPKGAYTRENWRQDLIEKFKLPEDQADAVVSVTDARASAWAKANGGKAENWYASRLKGVERSETNPVGVEGKGISKARVRFKQEGQAIINAFQKADVASALHEVGHVMRRDLPPEDLRIVEQWAGVKDGMWLKEATSRFGANSAEAAAARSSEEMFAKGFERYLQSGQAPTKELAGVFAKLRDWFTEIYRGIVGSGKIRMDSDVKAVFDRLLGAESKAVDVAAEGKLARALRKSLPDDARLAIDNWQTVGGHAHYSLHDAIKTHGAESVEAHLASQAELRFEEAWAQFKRSGEAPEGLQKAFDQMQALEDNLRSGSVQWIGRTKLLGKGPAPKLEMSEQAISRGTGKGIRDVHLMSLDEFKNAVSKSGALITEETPGAFSAITPNAAAILEAHERAIEKAVQDGYFVPARVFESHQGNALFERGGSLWKQNEANLTRLTPEQSLSITDMRRKVNLDLEKAQREYNAASTAANKVNAEALQKFVDDFEETVKAIPNHVQMYLTPESARLIVRQNLLEKGRLNNASLERGFLAAGGRPLTVAEVNDMVQAGPERIARMISMAGTAPEADLSLKDLFRAMNPDGPTIEGIAKASGKSPEEIGRMAYTEKLKYISRAAGRLFDERPEVLVAANLQTAARVSTRKDLIGGITNLFARKMPQETEAGLEASEIALREAKRAEIMELRRQGLLGSGNDEKLKALEESYRTTHRALPEGWVPADTLSNDPRLRGMMLKKDVYERAAKQLTSLDDPSWAKGFFKTIAKGTSTWKSLQVGLWPGSWFRDYFGSQMLRFQAGGFHPQTFAEMPALFKILGSNGDMEKLAKIGVKVGDKTIGGQEFWRTAMREGIFSHNMVTAELGETLAGRLEKSAVGKVASKGKDILHAAPNALQNSARLEMFHSRLVMGDTPSAAAAAVDSALFNYSRVSPFVDFARKTGIFPFATWASKNIPHQVELLFTRPGQFTALLHAKNAIEHGIPGVDEADLPKYLQDKWNIVLRKDAEGNVSFFTLSGVVPMADLPDVADPIYYMQQMLGPIPKFIVEQGANFDTYTRKTIEDFDGQYALPHENPLDLPITAREHNALKTVIGRPLTVAEKIAELTDESPDPRLGKSAYTTAKPLITALTGVPYGYRSAKDIAKQQSGEISKIESQARKTEELAGRYRQRGRPDMAARMMKQAQKLRQKKVEVLKRLAAEARTGR